MRESLFTTIEEAEADVRRTNKLTAESSEVDQLTKALDRIESNLYLNQYPARIALENVRQLIRDMTHELRLVPKPDKRPP